MDGGRQNFKDVPPRSYPLDTNLGPTVKGFEDVSY